MINVEWANEMRDTIVLKLSSGWTWEQYFVAQDEVSTMIESIPDIVVHCILLFPKNQPLPPNALGNLRKIVKRTHERFGIAVLVGVSPYTALMVNTLFKVIGYKAIHFVTTVAEAHIYLETLRQKSRPKA